jgi:hypothetical protein
VSGSRKTASGDNKNTHAQRRIEKNLLQYRREITETPCGYEIRYLRRASLAGTDKFVKQVLSSR